MRDVSELTPAPGSEGARRASGDRGARGPTGPPDPEVTERAQRRRFTTEYKLRILREADACKGDGDLGALLRREGLYSSHLANWRRQRDKIANAGMKARKRGPKPKAVDPRVKQLERENDRLKQRLEQAETIIAFQKKLSKLLGISLNSPDSDGSD
jgi:transposase